MKPLIKLKNLSVAYELGKSSELWAVRDVSLEIMPEEYVIFFGPSGSGKSTLLYIIAGLERPTAGEVLVDDKELNTLSEEDLMHFHRNTIGIIFQAFYLIPNLTVRDNIVLPQIFMNVPKEKRELRAPELAKRFNIGDLLSKKTTELSGGQQQRVAAVRALINDPEIILADEPVGNLDSKNAEITMELLAELNRKDKKTVILVTHDPRYLPYAHRVFYIQDGHVTREVRNEKVVGATGGPVTNIEKLAHAHPYLSEHQLYAKLIMQEAILPFSQEEQQKVEDIISQFLSGRLSRDKVFELLDAPKEKGGLSFYAQTAEKLVQKIEEASKEINLLKAHQSLKEQVLEIEEHLIKNYSGTLSSLQLGRL